MESTNDKAKEKMQRPSLSGSRNILSSKNDVLMSLDQRPERTKQVMIKSQATLSSIKTKILSKTNAKSANRLASNRMVNFYAKWRR